MGPQSMLPIGDLLAKARMADREREAAALRPDAIDHEARLAAAGWPARRTAVRVVGTVTHALVGAVKRIRRPWAAPETGTPIRETPSTSQPD